MNPEWSERPHHRFLQVRAKNSSIKKLHGLIQDASLIQISTPTQVGVVNIQKLSRGWETEHGVSEASVPFAATTRRYW